MLVYVASPCRATTEKQVNINIELARRLCEFVVDAGHTPLASHVFYRGLFDDKLGSQRHRAIEIGKKFVDMCDVIIHLGHKTSDGVRGETHRFTRNKPDDCRRLRLDMVSQQNYRQEILLFLEKREWANND